MRRNATPVGYCCFPLVLCLMFLLFVFARVWLQRAVFGNKFGKKLEVARGSDPDAYFLPFFFIVEIWCLFGHGGVRGGERGLVFFAVKSLLCLANNVMDFVRGCRGEPLMGCGGVCCAG